MNTFNPVSKILKDKSYDRNIRYSRYRINNSTSNVVMALDTFLNHSIHTNKYQYRDARTLFAIGLVNQYNLSGDDLKYFINIIKNRGYNMDWKKFKIHINEDD